MGTPFTISVENSATDSRLELEWSRCGTGTMVSGLPHRIAGRASWTAQPSGYAVGTSGAARYAIVRADGTRVGTAHFEWDAPFADEASCGAWVTSSREVGTDFFQVGHLRGVSEQAATFVLSARDTGVGEPPARLATAG